MDTRIHFPLSEEELKTFCTLLNAIDFDYFEQVLELEDIYKEDIEKIAVVKHCIEQINDKPKSRISWLCNNRGLVLPIDEELEEILDKYHK